MIFGFNTDIKVDDTVYHVQSEARATEKLLQTQVFVKGYCIGKRAVSYAEHEASGQSEDSRHELLREQHRNVVQAIREGNIDSVIQSLKAAGSTAVAPATVASPSPVAPAIEPAVPAPAIRVKFLHSARPTENALLLQFAVFSGDNAAEGARFLAQIMPATNSQETFSGFGVTEGRTNTDGHVELSLPLPPNPQGEASLVVQVEHQGATASKKFRIKTMA